MAPSPSDIARSFEASAPRMRGGGAGPRGGSVLCAAPDASDKFASVIEITMPLQSHYFYRCTNAICAVLLCIAFICI